MNYLTDGDIMFLFPSAKIFILCSEGTGDNLLSEDREEGYVDYINITSLTGFVR